MRLHFEGWLFFFNIVEELNLTKNSLKLAKMSPSDCSMGRGENEGTGLLSKHSK